MRFSIHCLVCAAALACIRLAADGLQLGAAVRIARTPSCCCIPRLCAVLARIRRSVARPDLEQLYEIQNKLDKSIARLGKIKVGCCAALRRAMLCCAVLCCAVLCCAGQASLCDAVLCAWARPRLALVLSRRRYKHPAVAVPKQHCRHVTSARRPPRSSRRFWRSCWTTKCRWQACACPGGTAASLLTPLQLLACVMWHAVQGACACPCAPAASCHDCALCSGCVRCCCGLFRGHLPVAGGVGAICL